MYMHERCYAKFNSRGDVTHPSIPSNFSTRARTLTMSDHEFRDVRPSTSLKLQVYKLKVVKGAKFVALRPNKLKAVFTELKSCRNSGLRN